VRKGSFWWHAVFSFFFLNYVLRVTFFCDFSFFLCVPKLKNLANERTKGVRKYKKEREVLFSEIVGGMGMGNC
jgi:hypothetical protein